MGRGAAVLGPTRPRIPAVLTCSETAEDLVARGRSRPMTSRKDQPYGLFRPAAGCRSPDWSVRLVASRGTGATPLTLVGGLR